MSYDLESIHARSGIRMASIRFATSTDLAGAIFIATQTDGQAVIHQMFVQASAYFAVQVTKATGGAAYGVWYGNQTGTTEPTRIPIDSGTACFIEAATGIGSGVVHGYYTVQRSAGVTAGSL